MLLLQRKIQRRFTRNQGPSPSPSKVRPERATSVSARARTVRPREGLLCFLNCERVACGLERSPNASRRTDPRSERWRPIDHARFRCTHPVRGRDGRAHAILRGCRRPDHDGLRLPRPHAVVGPAAPAGRAPGVSRRAAQPPPIRSKCSGASRRRTGCRKPASGRRAIGCRATAGSGWPMRPGAIAVCRLAHVQRLVQPGAASTGHRGAANLPQASAFALPEAVDASGAAHRLAVGLRQLPVRRRARRGAGHHARQPIRRSPA